MPDTTLKIDFTEFEQAINRAYSMGEIRRRDIANVFRKADKSIISAAKRSAGKSKTGMTSLRYPSRSHPPGWLRKNIKFRASKKYKLVYFVNSGAFYSAAYMIGHHRWRGNRFMDKALSQTEAHVVNEIRNGLANLTVKEWRNG